MKSSYLFPALLALALVAGCGGGGSSPSPSPTATPIATATPAATPTPIATATPVATATPIATATPAATATPVPTASPTATPGALSLDKDSLSFLDAATPQTVTATETGYTGTFTVDQSACDGIATIAATPGNGPSQEFTVTPVAAGECTVTVSGFSTPKAFTVTVTTTAITGQSVRRRSSTGAH